jgi:uncharacterized repeat protein (TIGR01451 family)
MMQFSKWGGLLLAIAIFLLVVSAASAEIIVPENGTTAFIQTSGPNAPLSNGDYRTNVGGDNLPHELTVGIACTPGQTYVFQLFDPAVDVAGNPPGFGADGTTARSFDEINPPPPAPPDPDDTRFELISPAGAGLADITYVPGTSDADWTTLATVGPITGTAGTDCGQYIVRARTGVDDENAWRFRLLGGGLPETFDPLVGPDGIVGTGDESWIGLQLISYQHAPPGCQTFYWFADEIEREMYMLNFDLDGNESVTYTAPNGQRITGTISANNVWNDAAPQQNLRPGYGDMEVFDAVADFAGDSIFDPQDGNWSAEICVDNTLNQYSFQVPNNIIFQVPPRVPELRISKTDFRRVVRSPGSTTYTITISNVGLGAALPIPGPEFRDTLPPNTSFVSCTVNAPLVGTCGETAPGSGLLEGELQAQPGYDTAYLPGVRNPPNNTGTFTVAIDIAAGLSDGTTLTNTASIEYTDVFANDYPPIVAEDTDIVRERPDDDDGDDDDDGNDDTDDGDDDDGGNIRITDGGGTPPPGSSPVCPTGADGFTSFDPQCAEQMLAQVRRLPATGESPWSKWRLAFFGGIAGGIMLAGWYWRRRNG